MQALKHALYAGASLAFGRFDQAAQHAIMAAKFAAAATGVGIAARGLAKSAGLYGSGSASGGAGASGGSSGSTGSNNQDKTTIINESRPRVVEHVIIIRPETGAFGQLVTAHIQEDVLRLNGPIRDTFKLVAES